MNEHTPSEVLDPVQTVYLFRLVLTGTEPSFSDKSFDIEKPRRDQLRALGLIDNERRQSIGKSGKKVWANYVFPTDKGWQWVAEHLDADFFQRGKNAGPALAGLLKHLKSYMQRHDVSLAELLSAKADQIQTASAEPPLTSRSKESTTSVETRIRDAYIGASRGAWNVRVRLAELRRRIADIPREIQDATLLQLQADGKLVLYRNNDPLDLNSEDQEAALDIVGEKRHIVYIKG